MTNKINRKSVVLILIFIFAVCFVHSTSLAGSFSASASKTTMTVGETATFTATASGCGGKFSVSSSDPSVVSVEGSLPWTENESNSVTLRANKAGTATITLTADNVADSSTADDITGSRSIQIKVNEPAPVVNEADTSLKSITVAGKTYTNPGTDFTVTVDSSVGSAAISAVPNNSSAQVSGTGTKELATGTNVATLTVSLNGATKKYTIRIRKLADTNNTPNVIEEPNNNNDDEPEEEVPQIEELRLEYLRIEDVELIPAFDSEVFEYSVEVTNIDRIDIIAVANVEDANIEIIGNTELIDGENEVIIKITKEEAQEVIYRIIVTKTTEVVVPPETEEENDNGTGGFLSTGTGKAVAGGTGTVAVGGLAFAVWKAKSAASIASGARRAAMKRASFNDFDD